MTIEETSTMTKAESLATRNSNTEYLNSIAHISESGTDTNGWHYEKWSDGKLIQHISKTGSLSGTWYVWGSTYTSEDVTVSDYPIEFYEDPELHFSGYTTSITSSVFKVKIDNPTPKTNAGAFQYFRGTTATETTPPYVLNILAIGRWKA